MGMPRSSPSVLLLTASVGEGHNAAAHALADALRRVEPACRTVTAGPLGGGAQAFTRWLYRLAIQCTPALQELWYRAVTGCPGVHWFYREVVGARVARVLAAELDAVCPDVVVSTYPLGTAGLAWLRRRGHTRVPLVAVLTDFAPHAFWVYPAVDRYLVLDATARDRMAELAPGVPTDVCALPVPPRFRPPSLARAARERDEPRPEGMSVLLTAGSLGLGEVTSAVRAVLDAGPGVRAVVVCGHNRRLRAKLSRRYPDHDRLRVLGWVEDMAGLMAGVDVVVNNAGGATATEALALGRALVLYRPIAGHGRDSARAMDRAGLASTGTRRRWLTGLLDRWADHPEQLHTAQRRASRHARRHRLEDTARAILAQARTEAGAGAESESRAEPGRVAS